MHPLQADLDPSPDTVVVSTPSGSVRGLRRPGSIAFLGVPYAEPPIGSRRFLAPQPRAPWAGIRDALAYGPTPQRRALAEITSIPEPSIPGEDTLSVNVFTPDVTPPAPLPVLVWIHGGGYVAGSPASPWYDGAAFNRDGVVVVSIAYRLGFDGFGWLPDAPQNRGVLDQLLALDWVQRHIASFGGDPQRVTIAGQSAGGGAVLSLLASPAAHGLFTGVVSISGAPADIPLDAARAQAEALATRLGVQATRDGFAGLAEDDVIREQGGGFDDLGEPTLDVLLGVARGLAVREYGPVVDGEVLPGPVAECLAAGTGAAVPLLLTATAEEFSGAFIAFADRFDGEDPISLLRRLGMDPGSAARYAALLPGLAPSALVGRWVTDTVFRAPAVTVVDARSAAAASTWLADFSWRGANGLAEHCLDVPFLFDVLADPAVERLTGSDPPQALADALHTAVVSFVRSGDPGWEPVASGAVLRFDETVERADTAYDSARALR